MTTTLWSNDNGSLVCERHAGNYLTAAIEARPRAHTHRTPLGTWDVVDMADLTAEFTAHGLPAPRCEQCPTT